MHILLSLLVILTNAFSNNHDSMPLLIYPLIQELKQDSLPFNVEINLKQELKHDSLPFNMEINLKQQSTSRLLRVA